MMKKELIAMMALLALTTGNICQAQTVVPQACEQSIITPKADGRYLWLPIEESAPEGKVLVIADGIMQMEQNVRMARARSGATCIGLMLRRTPVRLRVDA